MTTRPNIAYYEPDERGVERLVQRPMTVAEHRKHKADVKARAEAEADRKHPLIEQVASMSDAERAELRTLLEG